MTIELIEKVAAALSDQNRLKILQEIARRGTVTCKEAGEIIALSQPTVSHHIRLLVEAGLVETQKDGRCSNLTVNKKKLAEFAQFIEKIQA